VEEKKKFQTPISKTQINSQFQFQNILVGDLGILEIDDYLGFGACILEFYCLSTLCALGGSSFVFYLSSTASEMAPFGHSWAQIPHPLQYL
jgi:hypothetical protein